MSLRSLDLSQPSSPQEIYTYSKENAITVNILVNNAGIQVYGNFHEVVLADYMRLMSVNTNAMVVLTGLFVKDMWARKSGRILNIGSTGSFRPCPLNAIYCASKAFVLHFSEAIAEKLKGTGVTVTTLCPGATKLCPWVNSGAAA
ncbi:MAG: SDR family NAD(P)-dependent oxidoreductase [Geosporobacter ferrireducens]|nr:SDR family NAD(P)-dependent oxidoreductase [Geosporobacter ferrireducens]